ncbi:MAG: hypothetical protein HY537_00720 [Deltaproteobacteria bacterium]|nr:hypothetical protein [Deltaproteobacteria bacterium]
MKETKKRSKTHAIPQHLIDEVMKRLHHKEKPLRSKRTLVLTKATYDLFEQLCRKEQKYPSEVLDEFIHLFVEQKSKDV